MPVHRSSQQQRRPCSSEPRPSRHGHHHALPDTPGAGDGARRHWGCLSLHRVPTGLHRRCRGTRAPRPASSRSHGQLSCSSAVGRPLGRAGRALPPSTTPLPHFRKGTSSGGEETCAETQRFHRAAVEPAATEAAEAARRCHDCCRDTGHNRQPAETGDSPTCRAQPPLQALRGPHTRCRAPSHPHPAPSVRSS